MESHNMIAQLQDIGLSNKEAKVYVACIEIGQSPVHTIADRAEIKRVTAYVVLESLEAAGLVSRSERGSKIVFEAQDPSHFEAILRKRVEAVNEQVSKFKLILPALSSLQPKRNHQTAAKVYEGSDAIRAMIVEFLTTYSGKFDAVLSYLDPDQVGHLLPAKRFPGRILFQKPSHGASQIGSISVGTQHIIMLSEVDGNPVGVTIRNTQMANALRTILETAIEHSSVAE